MIAIILSFNSGIAICIPLKNIIMNYEFSQVSVLYFFVIAIGLISGITFLVKYLIKHRIISQININHYRRPLLLFGFSIALSTAFVIINITTVQSKNITVSHTPYFDAIEVEIPRTTIPKKKKLPKLPPPVIETVPENIFEEQPEFLSNEINIEDDIYLPEENTADVSKILPPPEIKNEEKDFPVYIVEQMPRFPGCEDLPTNNEREKCAQSKLMQYIYSNLKYPAIAIENGIEGRAVIRFVVDTTGKINNVSILRDPGGGCGQNAAKIIENMNKLPHKWTPGRQGGRKVNVYYTLPVIFKLK